MMSGNYWETEVYGVAPLAGLERIEADDVFDWLGESLPVKGSRVDWPEARGEHTHNHLDDETELLARATQEVLRRIEGGSRVEHVGDSLSPFGVRFGGEDASSIVAALLEIPEHHYFLDVHRGWLVVVSSEGDLDTLDRYGSDDES